MNKLHYNTEDLTGRVYGRLTIESFSKYIVRTYDKSRKSAFWSCKCSCGNTVVRPAKTLIAEQSLSCGCLRKERISESNMGKPGESGFNILFHGYKYSARVRKLSFKLSKKYFKIITQQNCHYCGKAPNTFSTSHKNNGCTLKAIENSKYCYNGVDRKNNNRGYTKENSVTCCSKCNYLKGTYGYEEFLLLIKNISNHLGLADDVL